ncbi:MAG TPA: hypothetical protein VF172_04185 [Nitrososphaera sp.]
MYNITHPARGPAVVNLKGTPQGMVRTVRNAKSTTGRNNSNDNNDDNAATESVYEDKKAGKSPLR